MPSVLTTGTPVARRRAGRGAPSKRARRRAEQRARKHAARDASQPRPRQETPPWSS